MVSPQSLSQDRSTHSAFLLDGKFPENLLFGQAKISMRIFELDYFGVIHRYFINKPSSRTWSKCKLPILTQ